MAAARRRGGAKVLIFLEEGGRIEVNEGRRSASE